MTGPETIVLVSPRRLDENLDRVIDDVRDLNVRMTDLGGKVARLDLAETPH